LLFLKREKHGRKGGKGEYSRKTLVLLSRLNSPGRKEVEGKGKETDRENSVSSFSSPLLSTPRRKERGEEKGRKGNPEPVFPPSFSISRLRGGGIFKGEKRGRNGIRRAHLFVSKEERGGGGRPIGKKRGGKTAQTSSALLSFPPPRRFLLRQSGRKGKRKKKKKKVWREGKKGRLPGAIVLI